MSIYEKLLNVQADLKAPKGQYNSFGKYSYRSCEDILEAVKPILKQNGLTLIIGDSVELIGERFYVKATARLVDVVDGTTIENSAFAREEQDKKGMDGSQITGTASSYARKYCLNGLFNIDDTKDADTDEYQKQQPKGSEKPAQKPVQSTSKDDEYEYLSKHVRVHKKSQILQVLTKKGWKRPIEIDLSTLVQMYHNELYQAGQFEIQLAINDKEAEQPA